MQEDAFSNTLQAALGPEYSLESELPGGGMSRVFVASDVQLGRKVVVKVLPPELAAGVNHERFRREIQVVAQLQHPHIVPLLAAGEQGSLIWYTMPYINGHSVREAIARGEKFSIRDVVRIMRNVADALDYAHGLGVIHRDIKPGNVLLLASHALVTDFGVSRAISASMPASGYTSAGMAIGTPAYMAPEQIAADPAADHRMDLYALGLLGYEMLTGEVPFKEDSPQKTMAAQLTRDPSPVETSRADVPPGLAALIRRLLAKLPADRPQSASAVVASLDDILVSSGATLAPLKMTRPPSVARTVGIVAAGIVVVAGAWALGQRTGETAGTSFLRDSLLAAESTQALAPAAAMLTREDSMAIAKAVTSRLAERPAQPRTTSARADSIAARAWVDSMRLHVQRSLLDSMLRREARDLRTITALVDAAEGTAAAPRTYPRRVVVALPRSSGRRPEIDAVAMALADSLRARIAADPRYRLVPSDSVAAVLRESRTVNTVQEKLNAELILSIALIPRADSITRMVQVRDLSAPAGINFRVVVSNAPLAAPAAGLGEFMPRVMATLEDLERVSRSSSSASSVKFE